MTYLVDTSVTTRLHVSEVASRLRELDPRGLARLGITDLEVGFSARTAREWDELSHALDALPRVDLEDGHLRRAAQVQRMLAEQGLRGRKIPDLLVAAAAEAAALTVLHYDADFEHIASVTGQETEWVVRAGSID